MWRHYRHRLGPNKSSTNSFISPWTTQTQQHAASLFPSVSWIQLTKICLLFFSLAQVRRLWWCFWFRSGLVALFLKMSERGDSWCTDSSFSSLLVKLSQVFESVCLTVFSSLRSSLLLVHIFLPNFFLPVNFAFNMLWYSTPWTAPPFSNDPLWLTLFVGGVNDRLLDRCQVSSVTHYCAFKRTRDIHDLYCMDGHSLKLKCKYSNILRYWFLT